MRQSVSYLALVVVGLLLVGVGCSSDPNVEGAKLDLRNNNYDQALNNISTALENNPENAAAWQVKGNIHQQQLSSLQSNMEKRAEVVDQMVEAYNNALEHGANEGEITQALKRAWVAEMQAGGNAYEAGADSAAAYDRAIHHFQNATEIQPDSVNSYVNLGYAYLASGQQQQAVEPFETAIDKGATTAELFLFLGQLYRQNDENEKAVAILEKGRELHPENEDITNQLMNAYVATDQISKAKESFEQAVKKDPDNEVYRYNYGTLLLEAEDYDAAIEHLSRAVELDSTYTSALYQLGAAHQNRAVQINDRIAELDKELRQEKADLSQEEIKQRQQKIEKLVEQRKEQFATAIPYLERARRLTEQAGEDPTDICRALFQAYAQTNQQEKAEDAANCAGIDVSSE